MIDIHAHIICWNREDTIALTIRHYQAFCSKIFIYDNFSTDRTREVAESLGAVVKTFGVAGSLDDGEYTRLKNNCWKGSGADYVIVVDDDEILYSEDLLLILRQEKLWGTTIFKPKGFSIHSESMPVNRWTEVMTGQKDNDYSKICIFDPKAVKEIAYIHGCHVANPVGKLQWNKEKLFLLHYRSVGGFKRLNDRHALYKARLSPINIRWGMGHLYSETEQQRLERWSDGIEKSESFSKVTGM